MEEEKFKKNLEKVREIKQKVITDKFFEKRDIENYSKKSLKYKRKVKKRHNRFFEKREPIGEISAPYNGLSLNDVSYFKPGMMNNNGFYCKKFRSSVKHNPLSVQLLGIGKDSYLAKYGITQELLYN